MDTSLASARLARIIALIFALAVAGCTKRPPVSPPPTPTKTPPTVNSAPEAPEHQASAAPAIAEVKPAEPAPSPAPETPSAPQTTTTSAPTHTPSTERLILFAPTQPLLVEFHLTIDGQPHTGALDRLVDKVLKLADENQDGVTTWKEIAASRHVKYGQYGNLPIENDEGLKQIVERYDIAKNDAADRDELPRFLTRNAGGSRPFSVRGTLSYHDHSLRSSPTWQTLDTDDDGRLSTAECAAARVRLAARDADDDEILVAADLAPKLDLPDGNMPGMYRRSRGPDAARLLGPHADWSTVQQALERVYGGDRFLRTGAFPASPELFAALDQNADGRLRKDEYPRLNELPPHVVVSIDFGSLANESADGQPADSDAKSEATEQDNAAAATSSNRPRVKLVSHAQELDAGRLHLQVSNNQVSLSLGGAVLVFFANDTVEAANFSARAKQTLAMFDQDKNGYLEKNELPAGLPAQFGRFEAVDANEDGKAYADEIAAFLSQQQAGLRSQIHTRVSDIDDGLFATLDIDQDGRLTSRELESAAARLTALDGDGDGHISPSETPKVIQVAVARGSVETPDATFARVPAELTKNESAPRWFRSMDANGDGVISRREFIGTTDQFTQLDKDANSLVTLDESK